MGQSGKASPAQEVFEKALAEQWRKTGCDATGAPYVLRALIARLSSPRLGIRLFLSKAVRQRLSRLPLSTRRRVLVSMGSPSSTRRRSKKSPRRPHRNRQSRDATFGVIKLPKLGFDTLANARLRHSSHGEHYRRDGLDPVKDASLLAPAKPVLRILDRFDPLATLAAVG